MKNLKVLFTVLCVACATSVWGEEELLYTLTATKNTSNSSYSSVYDVTINKVQWSIPGNQALTTTPPWKFGGKLYSATDRILYSKGSISGSISKIILTHGSKDTQITVKSCTVSVFSKADDAKNGSNPISSISATYVDNGSMTITKPNDVTWKDCYYRIVYNLSSSASSKNCGILFSKAEFYGSSGSGETTYSVTFDAGTNGTCSTTSLTEISQGSGVTLPKCNPNTDYTFVGWATTSSATSADAGKAGETYHPSEDCTLYAVYSAAQNYTVTWVVGSNPSKTQSYTTHVASGSKATPPAELTLTGSEIGDCVDTFVGWSKSTLKSPTNTPPSDLFTDESPEAITANTTFYAVFANK